MAHLITQIRNSNTWIFLICTGLVFFTQFTLFEPVIQYRLFTEDWQYLPLYKFLYPNPFLKIIDVWTHSGGLHITAQIYHIGILSSFLGTNYSAYHVVNVILKAIAALTLFPLILILFKNKLLAFLTTILYAISSASAGSLIFVVKGSEYLAISSLNIFLISYYYSILKKSYLSLILSSFLFLLTFLLSPSRLFPIFLLVFLIEIMWIFKTRQIGNIKFSILRLISFYVPAILISLPSPVSTCCPFSSRPQMVLKEIIDGNWHNALIPFAGIGFSLLTTDYIKFFGSFEMRTFSYSGEYLSFLIQGPIIIFFLLTVFLSLILSKKPLKFFFSVFLVNLFLEILMFFIANHHFYILSEKRSFMDPYFYLVTKVPTLWAIYIFTLAFFIFLEWKKDKEKNNVLVALWVGPLFSAIFLWPTWLIIGTLIGYYTSVSWYLIIPPIGTSLFLAAILVLFYQKFKKPFVKVFTISLIFVIIYILYRTSGTEISRAFSSMNSEGLKLTDQRIIQDKLITKLGDNYKNGNMLLYFDFGSDHKSPKYYQDALFLNNIGHWILFRRDVKSHGCIASISDISTLKKVARLNKGEVEFVYIGNCIETYRYDHDPPKGKVIYRLNNFFAYRVENGEFIDIKEQIFKELDL